MKPSKYKTNYNQQRVYHQRKIIVRFYWFIFSFNFNYLINQSNIGFNDNLKWLEAKHLSNN